MSREDYILKDSYQRLSGSVPPVDSQTTGGTRDAPDGHAESPDLSDTIKELEDKINQFSSGAKSSGHKPPYECLTETLLRRAAMRMQLGMHYGKHNWKKGINDKAFILDRLNHAVEHLMKALHQIDCDNKMMDDDLAAVVVNCMFAMEYQENFDSPSTPSRTRPNYASDGLDRD